MIRIGVDLGGTKTEIIAIDCDGKELIRKRVQTPKDDYHRTLHSIVALVDNVETTLGISSSSTTVGIATPGAISAQTGLLKNSNSICLNNQKIQYDIETLLNKKIRISNDANCFALSEATDGNAMGVPVVFGVIVGTGTGAGIIVNGKLLSGANAIAGEWGHNPIPWPVKTESPGPTCYCGKCGCIETFLSGPGLQYDFKSVSGRVDVAEEIVKKSEHGDAACEASLQRYEDRMARSLAQVINILDPDIIVLGGGMSNIKRLYKNVPERWGQYVFSDTVETKLLPAKYGDSSGVRGAAWLWD